MTSQQVSVLYCQSIHFNSKNVLRVYYGPKASKELYKI